MPGGYYSPSDGDVWSAANFDTYVRDQTVNKFASAAARDAAIASPGEGMYADLADVDGLSRHSGSAWQIVASASSWTDYSSSLAITASTSSPTKGNSTYTSRYLQVGKMVYYSAKILIGSTFVAGSGSYSFSLPVTAQGSFLGAGSVGVVESGVGLRVGAFILSSAAVGVIYVHNIGSQLDSSGPTGGGWSTNDSLTWSVVYEAA